MIVAERYVEKTRTWADNWNNVVRRVLFKDDELRRLMLIPEDCTVTQFVQKYFIEDDSAGEIITDEAVRIIYHDEYGPDSGNSHIHQCYKEFDIFVKDNVMYTASRDRLQTRTHLIAERLKYLLLRQKNVEHMSFRYRDEYHLWTKTAGFRRYHVIFSYKTTA